MLCQYLMGIKDIWCPIPGLVRFFMG